MAKKKTTDANIIKDFPEAYDAVTSFKDVFAGIFITGEITKDMIPEAIEKCTCKLVNAIISTAQRPCPTEYLAKVAEPIIPANKPAKKTKSSTTARKPRKKKVDTQ